MLVFCFLFATLSAFSKEPLTASNPIDGFAGESSANDPLFDLEQLFAASKFEEGLRVARQRLQDDPKNPDVYWHVSRFMYEVAETFDPADQSIDRISYYEEMLRVAEAGLAIDPENPQTRFSRGVARGRLATTRGVMATLWAAKGIEQDLLFTANSGEIYSSLDGRVRLPCDAHYGLGIFYRLVPDSWMVQMLAGTRGSLEKSHELLAQANRACPSRIRTMKELGATKMCMAGKKDENLMGDAKALLNAALQRPAEDGKDAIDLKHVRLLLANPKMACGYSRDGQQDQDVGKLKKR